MFNVTCIVPLSWRNIDMTLGVKKDTLDSLNVRL